MMTSVQMLRHLRRHPHRREVVWALQMLSTWYRGRELRQRPWSRTLETIWKDIVR